MIESRFLSGAAALSLSDPYTATAPEHMRFSDGSALLANPAAAAAWTEHTSGENLPGLPFPWHLPAG